MTEGSHGLTLPTEQDGLSHHTQTLKSLDVKDINQDKSRQKDNFKSGQWILNSGTDNDSNYLFTSVERVNDEVNQGSNHKSNYKAYDMAKPQKVSLFNKNLSSNKK